MVEKLSGQQVVIDRFVGDFAFLSNFYPSTISHDGKLWHTCEHVYQAYKSLDENVRETIRKAKTAAEAKKLGQAVIIRPDWETAKFALMRVFVKKKFENPFLREMLLATGDAKLVAGNHWNDTTWGVCRGVGKNMLGIILMETRSEILQEIASQST